MGTLEVLVLLKASIAIPLKELLLFFEMQRLVSDLLDALKRNSGF